jgi:4-amino-4-deoxy-L-arabinose transferase-like glycosyltransferase
LNFDRRALALVTLLALATRIVFVSFVHPAPIGDFWGYYYHAIQLTQGLGYETRGMPTALYPMGWPIVLAGIVKIFGPNVPSAEIFEAIFGGLAAGLVYLIAQRIAGSRIAIVAGLLYALLPSNIEFTSLLASDTPYTLLWLVLTYIWLRLEPDSLGGYAASGILLGLTAIVRPTALAFWIPLAVYRAVVDRGRTHVRRTALPIVVMLAFAALAIAPVTIRNYVKLHAFVLVSSNGGITMYSGNNPQASGVFYNDDLEKASHDPAYEVETDALAGRLATRYALTHPAREFRLFELRMYYLYVDDVEYVHEIFETTGFSSGAVRFVRLLNRVTYWPLMLLALIGIIACFSKRRPPSVGPGWILLFSFVVINTAVFAVSIGDNRYRYPTMAFFAIFAAIGIEALLRLRPSTAPPPAIRPA